MHLLEFLWVCSHDRHPQRLYIGKWLLLGYIFIWFFLVHLLEFFLVWPPYWHPWRYWWGGLLLWIFPLGISMPYCVHFLVLLVKLLVLDYVLNKLNPVWHELLHLWRTFFECWIVWRKTLLCMIFFPLFVGCVCLMASAVFHFLSYLPDILSMWCQWCSFSVHC